MEVSTHNLGVLVACCQKERAEHQTHHTTSSPCCVELLHRAFRGEQDAIAQVQRVFNAWVQRCVHHFFNTSTTKQRVDCHHLDREEIVQDSWWKFWQYAPHIDNPDHLGVLLRILSLCIRSVCIDKWRELKCLQREWPLLYKLEYEAFLPISDVAQDVEQKIAYEDLSTHIHHLLTTDKERTAFDLYFVLGLKQKDILERYSGLFANWNELQATIQRIQRRLRKDSTLRQWCDLPAEREKMVGADTALFMRMVDDTYEVKDYEQMKEQVQQPCSLGEDVLFDYVTGVATPDIGAAIKQSPACMVAAAYLAHELHALQGALYRMQCPDSTSLVAYHTEQLTGAKQQAIHNHVMLCPLCQEELALLDAIDAIETDEELLEPTAPFLRHAVEAMTGIVRTMIDAIAQPVIALGVMGEHVIYTSPHFHITINTEKGCDKPHTWTLFGDIRTPDGLLATGQIDAVLLQQLNLPNQPEVEAALGEDAESTFTCEELAAGIYCMRIVTKDEEIVVHQLHVGKSNMPSK